MLELFHSVKNVFKISLVMLDLNVSELCCFENAMKKI